MKHNKWNACRRCSGPISCVSFICTINRVFRPLVQCASQHRSSGFRFDPNHGRAGKPCCSAEVPESPGTCRAALARGHWPGAGRRQRRPCGSSSTGAAGRQGAGRAIVQRRKGARERQAAELVGSCVGALPPARLAFQLASVCVSHCVPFSVIKSGIGGGRSLEWE